METIFKLEAVFACLEDLTTWRFDSMYTRRPFKEVLDAYIDDAKKLVGKEKYLHHIIVTELPLDRCVEEDEFVSEYVYLPNGELYVSREYHNLPGDDRFYGRKAEELPLKVGDKAMWFEKDSIYTGVIYSLPPEPGKYEYMDVFDDCYTILEGLDDIPENVSDELYMETHKNIDVNIVFKIK